MITLIVQVDSEETMQDLKLFAEMYCKGLKIEATASHKTSDKHHNLTSKKACASIDIFETQYGKISNVEFCELSAGELEEFLEEYNDTDAISEIVHTRGDNEYLKSEVDRLEKELQEALNC